MGAGHGGLVQDQRSRSGCQRRKDTRPMAKQNNQAPLDWTPEMVAQALEAIATKCRLQDYQQARVLYVQLLENVLEAIRDNRAPDPRHLAWITLLARHLDFHHYVA
jgi:hypothetical protein